MRIQQAIVPLLTLALSTTPALGQEESGQNKPTQSGLVRIEVERTLPAPPWAWSLGPLNRLSFDWLSRLTPIGQPSVRDAGVGFVARADGLVVTSLKLVQGASPITVSLEDGRRLPGEVVAIDSVAQTAILRVDASDLPVLSLRDPSDLRPGERLTLGYTKADRRGSCVYMGREACKGSGRELPLLAILGEEVTTPPLGTPLLTEDGHVVGLNTQLLTIPLPVGGALRLAYATPVDTARRLVADVPCRDPPQPRFSFDELGWDWGSVFPGDSSLQSPGD